MTPGQALKEEEAWGCRGAVRACPFQCRWKWHDGVSPSSSSVRVAYSGHLRKDSSLIRAVRVSGT